MEYLLGPLKIPWVRLPDCKCGCWRNHVSQGQAKRFARQVSTWIAGLTLVLKFQTNYLDLDKQLRGPSLSAPNLDRLVPPVQETIFLRHVPSQEGIQKETKQRRHKKGLQKQLPVFFFCILLTELFFVFWDSNSGFRRKPNGSYSARCGTCAPRTWCCPSWAAERPVFFG